MATKKNPLSALLSTDERQQVQEMQREHVIRSSVRQAGTYGVGVQKPLPISQTSLGRLSNSLGTVSGILGQFSAYQAQKEQVELKGQGLQSKLNLQGIASKEADLNLKGAMIQGDILDETVKQQSMKLEEAQTRRIDAEWDFMLSQANDEQVDKMIEEANEQVRRQKAKLAKAELGVEQANPGEHTESPLYSTRALRFLGATFVEEYDEYHRQQTKELIESLADNPNGSNLSREEALDLAQKTMRDFMLLKKLDPEGEVGKGFIQATDRLRASKNPILASKLMDESEVLNTQNMIGAMKAAAELGPVDGNYGQGLISESPWFIQLSGMSQTKARAVLFGTQGDPARGIPPTPGLYGMMSRTHDGAVKFQAFFEELTDELHINNRPFKELPEFDSLQAQVEETVEKTALDEVKKENSAFSVAWQETADKLPKLSSSMSPQDIALATANLIDVNETPDQLREKLLDRFPSLRDQIAQITDDKLYTYAFDLVNGIKGGGDRLDAVTDVLMARVVPHLPRLDRREGLLRVLQKIGIGVDSFPGGDSVSISGLISNFVTGFGEVGSKVTPGLKDSGGGFMVGEIDDLTAVVNGTPTGVITRYTRDLNNLNDQVLASLPKDATEDDFNKAYKEGFNELSKNLENDLAGALIKHAKTNQDYVRKLDGDAEDRRSLPPNAALVPTERLKTLQNKNPTMTFEEVVKLGLSQGAIEVASGLVLRNAFAESSQEAKALNKTYVSTKKALKAEMERYTEEGGNAYEQVQDISTRLALYGRSFWTKDVEKHYEGLIGEMNAAAEANYSTSVTIEEIKGLASGIAPVNPLQPWFRRKRTPFIVKMGDDFLNIKPYKKPGPSDFDFSGVATLDTNITRDADGNVNTHEDWNNDISRDVTLRHDLFKENQPPVTGLPFGSSEPTANDVDKIRNAVGLSIKELDEVSSAFGFDNSFSFLKSQYNNAYYSNQRKAKTK